MCYMSVCTRSSKQKWCSDPSNQIQEGKRTFRPTKVFESEKDTALCCEWYMDWYRYTHSECWRICAMLSFNFQTPVCVDVTCAEHRVHCIRQYGSSSSTARLHVTTVQRSVWVWGWCSEAGFDPTAPISRQGFCCFQGVRDHGSPMPAVELNQAQWEIVSLFLKFARIQTKSYRKSLVEWDPHILASCTLFHHMKCPLTSYVNGFDSLWLLKECKIWIFHSQRGGFTTIVLFCSHSILDPESLRTHPKLLLSPQPQKWWCRNNLTKMCSACQVQNICLHTQFAASIKICYAQNTVWKSATCFGSKLNQSVLVHTEIESKTCSNIKKDPTTSDKWRS